MEKNYQRTGLSLMNFYSICTQESSLRKHAIGIENKDDVGLCQINKHTYRYFHDIGIVEEEWDVDKMKSIEYNIKVSSLILEKYRKDLKRRFPGAEKDFIDMLLIESYNKGVGGSVVQLRKQEMEYYISVIKWNKIWRSI